MNRILRKVSALFVVSRETLDRDTLAAVLRDAWVDNAPDGQFFYARGWARSHFNQVVGKYVAEYYASTGRLPEGNHFVNGRHQKMVYFASRKSPPQSAGRLSAAASSSA